MRDAPVPAAAAPPGQGAITLAPCPPARLDRLAALRQLPGQYAGDGAEMILDESAEALIAEVLDEAEPEMAA